MPDQLEREGERPSHHDYLTPTEHSGHVEFLGDWTMIVGGAVLLAVTVAMFCLGLCLFGGLGAWLAGILAYVLGLIGVGWFWSRPTGPVA